MVVLGTGAVSYEPGTPVFDPRDDSMRLKPTSAFYSLCTTSIQVRNPNTAQVASLALLSFSFSFSFFLCLELRGTEVTTQVASLPGRG